MLIASSGCVVYDHESNRVEHAPRRRDDAGRGEGGLRHDPNARADLWLTEWGCGGGGRCGEAGGEGRGHDRAGAAEHKGMKR